MAEGATVELTATVESPHELVAWRGDCDGAEPQCTIEATQNRVVTLKSRRNAPWVDTWGSMGRYDDEVYVLCWRKRPVRTPLK